MAFMVAAYLVIWLATFLFVFSIMQRQRTIQREIAALRELAPARDYEPGEIEAPVTARVTMQGKQN
jgi:CcmD family protein